MNNMSCFTYFFRSTELFDNYFNILLRFSYDIYFSEPIVYHMLITIKSILLHINFEYFFYIVYKFK